jgi:DNA excision repair protein ERCC-2
VCHGDSCPLVWGFYDRFASPPAPRPSKRACSIHESLREVALAHQVCPYYLGQEVVRWCDVIVGDYNHYFDSTALLHGVTQANSWRIGLLVDEAHNLVDRARAMYSASLHSAQLRALRAVAPAGLKKSLDRLQRSWSRLTGRPNPTLLDAPPSVASALQDATGAIRAAADSPTVDRALLQLYFDALRFIKLLTASTHSTFDNLDSALGPGRRHGGSALCVRNLLPAVLEAALRRPVGSAVLGR